MRPTRAGADISSPCSPSRFLRAGRPDLGLRAGGPRCRPEGAAVGSTVFTGGPFPAGRTASRLPAPADAVLRDLVAGVVGEILVDGAGGLVQGGLRVGAA